MQVHLTRVFRTSKDKQGNPLKTKAGKPYERISIKTEEHGDKWLSGFGAQWNDNWNEGDVVDIEVEESGQYLNFKKVDELALIKDRLSKLEQAVFGNQPSNGGPDTPEIDDDDIPF